MNRKIRWIATGPFRLRGCLRRACSVALVCGILSGFSVSWNGAVADAVGIWETVWVGAFEELKRRNVFRVAAAYVVVSWLIVQIADVVLGNIGAPDWVIQTLFLILGIGFVLAIVFSWAYELTPEGIKRESDVEHDKSITHHTAKRLNYVTIAAAIAVAGMFVWQQFGDAESAQTGQGVAATSSTDGQKTIAVLPFLNMSSEAENEYFSDGISEELLNTLVRIDGLQVASRTSAFSFKDADLDIPTIASRLNVDHIVEGSVRRAGTEVRITAQLIDVASDRHLWSESYTRELSDVFAIQDEIAQAIADALELTLLGVNAGRRTDNIEAHDLYLLGRHEFHQRTGESLSRAIDLFEQAIAIDPDYALAYSGLADTYSLIFQYGDFDPLVAFERAEKNARKAIELAPELAEAHASLGLSLATQSLISEAREHYRHAIELNPDYSMAHMWLGNALRNRPAEALEAFRAAERVDPLHPVIAENIGDMLADLGRFEEAAAHYDRAILNHPDTVVLYFSRSGIEFDRGRLDEAYRFSRRALAIEPDSPYALQAIAYAEMDIGNFDRAERWIARFLEAAPDHPEQTWLRFSLMESRGEFAAIIDYLERRRAEVIPTIRPFIDLSMASVELRLGRPEAALPLLEEITREQAGVVTYLFVLNLTALAEHELGLGEDAIETADSGFELVRELRDLGHNQSWLYEQEAIFYAIRGQIDDALAAMRSAFELGSRNIYGFSAFWVNDRLLGDDPRYQAIRKQIYDDVERMQREINAEIDACRNESEECTLASIDDV